MTFPGQNPVSGDKEISLFPGTGKVPLSWEMISCFQEDSRRSEHPSHTGCFLNNFNNNQYGKGTCFGVSCPASLRKL